MNMRIMARGLLGFLALPLVTFAVMSITDHRSDALGTAFTYGSSGNRVGRC